MHALLRSRIRYTLVAVGAVALIAPSLVVVTSSDAYAQPTNAAAEDPDQLYKQGIDAFRGGKLDDAFALLSRAWGLKQSVDIAANLGVVEQKLGKNAAAAEHLTYAIRQYPPSGDPAALETLKNKLDAAKREVGTVKIVSNVEGAEIDVDGATIGKAPIADDKFIPSGQRRFVAKAKGYEDLELTMKIDPGSTLTVDLKLVPKKGGGANDGTGDDGGDKTGGPPSGDADEKPLWPTIVLAGVGAIGVGMGIGFVVMAEGAKSSLEDGTCKSVSCASNPEVASDVDDYNLGLSIAIPSFVVGGLALIGMVTYLAIPGGDDEPAGAPAKQAWAVPWIGPDVIGASVGGTF